MCYAKWGMHSTKNEGTMVPGGGQRTLFRGDAGQVPMILVYGITRRGTDGVCTAAMVLGYLVLHSVVLTDAYGGTRNTMS